MTARPTQRPMLLGPKERRLFGGPWHPQDAGYAITRSAEGGYLVAAGSLAGLGKGAQLAGYGPDPALFPPLNSEADKRARLGVLVVENAEPAQALAWPSPKGAEAFDIPQAARGRLIKQGAPDLLRVTVSQNLDPAVRRLLDNSAKFDRFVLLSEQDPTAECRVGQYPNGDIWIGDDLFGPGRPLDSAAPGPIEFLDGDVVVKARSGKLFWHQNIIGKPFVLVSPDGYEWGIDRLVAIATDQKGMDLRVLDQRLTMQEAMREALGTKSVEMTARNPPALRWTAVQTLIQIGGPDSTSSS